MNHIRIKLSKNLLYNGMSIRNFSKVRNSAIGSTLKTVSELTKFRLSSLVVFTTAAGFICAGSPIDMVTMAYACTGTALCAASAGTFNQVFEIENDRAMKRTINRPLPSGKVTATQAAMLGGVTGLTGTAMLALATNPTVALLGASNIVLYAGVYTYSKRYTELNTWIGSIVGAIPPIMGWCAATNGSLVEAEPWILGSLLFLWQFPHFFALSWLYRDDYERGGFQMVPVNDPTGVRTAGFIKEYTYYLTAFPIVTTALGYTSYMYTIEGTAANMYLLYLAHKFSNDRTNGNARKIFLCSLWYLPLLLAGYVFHTRMWDKKSIETEDEQTDQISEAVLQAKETLKGMCVHEMLANPQEQTSSSSTSPQQEKEQKSHEPSLSSILCLKTTSEKMVESTLKAAETTVKSKSEKKPTE